jgi:hypothetical protein
VLADVLHQAGREAEAGRLFAEAEAMQVTRQPNYPLLYSFQGFSYCDLLLAAAERAASRLVAGGGQSSLSQPLTEACRAVAERVKHTIEIAMRNNWLLDIGHDHLTLARAALYVAILDSQHPRGEHLREATAFVRRAAAQEFEPRALLPRALFRAVTGAFDGARDDLDEAQEIAERGQMKLHLADIHLDRARLFGLMPSRPEKYPWTSARDDLDAASKLVDECGYGRRHDELADAEAAYQRIHGGAG